MFCRVQLWLLFAFYHRDRLNINGVCTFAHASQIKNVTIGLPECFLLDCYLLSCFAKLLLCHFACLTLLFLLPVRSLALPYHHPRHVRSPLYRLQVRYREGGGVHIWVGWYMFGIAAISTAPGSPSPTRPWSSSPTHFLRLLPVLSFSPNLLIFQFAFQKLHIRTKWQDGL